MIVTSRKILAGLLALNISACSFIDKTEINTLKQTAISDAQKEPASLKLDYIKCYALERRYKQQCYNLLSKYSERRKNAASWVYTTSFDKEMELQGFAAFLGDAGKNCGSITKEPKLIDKYYKLSCTSGKSYNLTLNRNELSWSVVD